MLLFRKDKKMAQTIQSICILYGRIADKTLGSGSENFEQEILVLKMQTTLADLLP